MGSGEGRAFNDNLVGPAGGFHNGNNEVGYLGQTLSLRRMP